MQFDIFLIWYSTMPMISLQVTQELMDEFDKVWERMNISSRSEALRKSILYFIDAHKQEAPVEGRKVAVLTVHHETREDILDKFTEYINKYNRIVKSVNSYNLKTRVLKSIIVGGLAAEINDFYNELQTDRLFITTISYIIIPEDEQKKKIEEAKSPH